MQLHRITAALVVATLTLMSTGCDEDESRRMVEMAEKHLERQAEQNRQMTELQRQVAEGANRLVEADAQARQEMVAMQHDIQAERAEVGRQRDHLEGERRELEAKRRLDPIIASAITNMGLLLACLLPLVLCWYLLHARIEPADDGAIAEVLLEDLVIERPLLLPGNGRPRPIGFDESGHPPGLPSSRRRANEASEPTD